MSVQLKELIDRIKEEGVKEAEVHASEIKKKAAEDASHIVAEAKRKAEDILAEAKRSSEQFETAAKEAIRQAGRDMILTIKSEIKKIFESLLFRETGKALDVKTMQEAILILLRTWGEKADGLNIVLPERECEAVQEYVMGQLSSELKKGVHISPSAEFEKGFKVAERDGAAFYDFTDRGLTEFLLEYLNPKIADLLEGE